jgi:hypothetical protein
MDLLVDVAHVITLLFLRLEVKQYYFLMCLRQSFGVFKSVCAIPPINQSALIAVKLIPNVLAKE